MNDIEQINLQSQVDAIKIPFIKSLHKFDVPDDFYPWECELSPSALYNCALSCRKKAGLKTPEQKLISIKRWVTITPGGIQLPPGVFYSIKRKEEYVADPVPKFDKIEYVVLLFPYGNTWSKKGNGEPFTDDWLFSSINNELILKLLIEKDAAKPIEGYFESCYKFFNEHPEQVAIHLKRKRKD